MAKLEFGWFVPPIGIAETEYVPLAKWQQDKILPVVVEHFDSLWAPDHFYAFEDPANPWLECWTVLTWLAARFPTMKVGQVVLAVGYRNPALLAKMAATLQELSGGRLILGIGAGWRAEEYEAYGYDFPATVVRVKQLDEAVQIMRLMWTESTPTFKGEHFHIEKAYCAPRPTPVPPIMIGGSGEQLVLPLIARLADIWDLYHGHTYDTIDLEAYRRKRDIVRRPAEAAGRDPSKITQSVTIGEAKLPETSDDSKSWLRHLEPLVELGVSQFILDCGHVASPEPVARFGEEVISVMNRRIA